jgi:putative acetyltransferase
LTKTNGVLEVLVRKPDTDGMDVTIRPLETAADAAAFRALNEEWIARYFVIEEQDRRQLNDPVAAYIDTGGEILIAEFDGRPVGCVALMPDGTGAHELSKMAVSRELRGRGAGRKLLTAAVDHARKLGARSLFLGSSWKLANAVHLYETLGFQHVPPETLHMPYARADVFMELQLQPQRHGDD